MATFTPPTNLAPYQPAQNVVTVTLVQAGQLSDIYEVSPGNTEFVVVHGTPIATVTVLASAASAWAAFSAWCGPAILTQPYRLNAVRWFYQTIEPLYVT